MSVWRFVLQRRHVDIETEMSSLFIIAGNGSVFFSWRDIIHVERSKASIQVAIKLDLREI